MSLIRAVALLFLLSASGDALSKCLMVGQLKGWRRSLRFLTGNSESLICALISTGRGS